MRRELTALGLAVRLLTRLPLRGSEAGATFRATPATAVPYYPLVGILIGAISGTVFCLAHLVFPVTLAVVLATAASLLVTGALHEDGFADACDGLGGGTTRERVLEIMRDSRLGTYGAAGLGLLLAAKVLALSAAPVEVIPWLLVAAHAASRASAALALATGTYARGGGRDRVVSRGFTARARRRRVRGPRGCGRDLPVADRIHPGNTPGRTGGPRPGALPHAPRVRAQARGYTGDCLGGVQQTSELGLYLGAVAAM